MTPTSHTPRGSPLVLDPTRRMFSEWYAGLSVVFMAVKNMKTLQT
jgi:hypothetical protein